MMISRKAPWYRSATTGPQEAIQDRDPGHTLRTGQGALARTRQGHGIEMNVMRGLDPDHITGIAPIVMIEGVTPTEADRHIDLMIVVVRGVSVCPQVSASALQAGRLRLIVQAADLVMIADIQDGKAGAIEALPRIVDLLDLGAPTGVRGGAIAESTQAPRTLGHHRGTAQLVELI